METYKATSLRCLIIVVMLIGVSLVCCVSICAEETPATAPTATLPPEHAILCTVPVGEDPSGVAVDAETKLVYVANWTSGTVSIIDEKTATVIKTISVGLHPSNVAVNPATNRIYVTSDENYLIVLDGETNTVCAKIPMASPAQSVDVNTDTNRIYELSGGDGENLRIFDGCTHTQLATNSMGAGPEAVAVNPVTNRIYVIVWNQVSVVDGKTNAVTDVIHLKSVPICLAVAPYSNRIYLTTTDDQLFVLDGKTNAILLTVQLAKGLSSIAINPFTEQLFLCNINAKTFSIFDGMTNLITSTISMAEYGAPYRVDVDTKTNRVYITMRETNKVCIVHGEAFMTESQSRHAMKVRQHAMSPPPRDLDRIAPFTEQFSSEELEPTRWVLTRSEPFAGSTIDLAVRNQTERWLRLRLDTSQSPNKIKKFHGVRTHDAVIDFEHPTEINFTLDWNHPADSYRMSAGVYLCPDAKAVAPGLCTGQFIKVMYCGLPTHLEVSINGEDQVYILYDQGYSAHLHDSTKPFTYHTIGVQQIRIVVDNNAISVWENNNQVCQCNFTSIEALRAPLNWHNGYLYLQQECSFGEPAREVFFNNIFIHRLRNSGSEPKLYNAHNLQFLIPIAAIMTLSASTGVS